MPPSSLFDSSDDARIRERPRRDVGCWPAVPPLDMDLNGGERIGYPVVQVTREDVAASSTLSETDVGKWCFVVLGELKGFFGTREEASSSSAQRLCLLVEDSENS